MAFSRVFTMYQICYIWIHPFHHSPLSPSPDFWNPFNRYHFCIYIHVYTLFALHSSSYFLSLSHDLPPPTDANQCPSSQAGSNYLFICLNDLQYEEHFGRQSRPECLLYFGKTDKKRVISPSSWSITSSIESNQWKKMPQIIKSFVKWLIIK
jgi:hypothetical protein